MWGCNTQQFTKTKTILELGLNILIIGLMLMMKQSQYIMIIKVLFLKDMVETIRLREEILRIDRVLTFSFTEERDSSTNKTLFISEFDKLLMG